MASSHEDDILLENYRNVSLKWPLIYALYAFLAAMLTPIWLFSEIQHLDFHENWSLYAMVSLPTSFLVIISYRNCMFFFKHQIAKEREEAVRREINANKNLTREEKADQILWKKNEVAEYEAINYSIFYNNLIFFATILLCSFLVFKRLSPSVNYALSSLLSSGLVALLSTRSSQKKS